MTASSPARRLVGRVAPVVAGWSVSRLVASRPPHDDARWQRTNYDGAPVSLWEGPAVATGLCAGILAATGSSRRDRVVSAAAVSAAAVVGLVDDQFGTTHAKGLGGHVAALRRGQVTTGSLKVAGLGVIGLATAVALRPRDSLAHQLAAGALVAGTGNLINLFDLRPGRALKAAGILGLVAQASRDPLPSLAGATVGTAAGVAPADLAAASMLGDCGANALGVALGAAAVAGLTPRAIWMCLAAVTGLTLASERVSFSDVIARVGVLRQLDEWGRPQPSSSRA